MSFDWNLSSDEEEGFDDWAKVNLQESLKENGNQTTSSTHDRTHSEDDDSSNASRENDRKQESITAVSFFSGQQDMEGTNNEESDDENDDDINWEDATEDDVGLEDGTPGTLKLASDNVTTTKTTLKPVTVDWNKKKEDHDDNWNKKSSKIKSRRSYRFDRLPPDMQRLLTNLQRTHLLSLTSSARYVSKSCSDDELLHLATSLIPEQLFATVDNSSSMNDPSSNGCMSTPNEAQLKSFCCWYFDLVNKSRQRLWQASRANYAAGAPRRRRKKRASKKGDDQCIPEQVMTVGSLPDYCSYLARSLDDNPQLSEENTDDEGKWTQDDKVRLLVSMARSFGWRARYVMALEPLKKDLDVNHPLLTLNTTRDVFQTAWKDIQARRSSGRVNDDDDDGGGKMPAKRRRISKDNKDNTNSSVVAQPPVPEDHLASQRTVSWVEILCMSSTGRGSSKKPSRTTESGVGGSGKKVRWVHVDPNRELINQPGLVESILFSEREQIRLNKQSKRRIPIAYALAAEHVEVSSNDLRERLTDVTPRYATSWVETLKMRGVLRGKQSQMKDEDRVDIWWSQTIKSMNGSDTSSKGTSPADAIVIDAASKTTSSKEMLDENGEDTLRDVDVLEKEELSASVQDEPIPTSKTAFKAHPIYVIPSILNANEVLLPDAKSRVCGVFKGELVYRRIDVSVVLPAKKWLYKGRKVKNCAIGKPIKRIQARKKPVSKNFKALKSYGVGSSNDGSEAHRASQLELASRPLADGMVDVYAKWQTDPWRPPPVHPEDPIPVNEFGNIELELMNPGLAHVNEERIAVVAKQLGIPYAPCLLGFEGHGGNRTPTVRGIVVHQHNEELLLSASVEVTSQAIEESHSKLQHSIYKRWKKLFLGVLTNDRLEREYGTGE